MAQAKSAAKPQPRKTTAKRVKRKTVGPREPLPPQTTNKKP